MAKEITCKHCGKVFTNRHIHVNFCSVKCAASYRAAPIEHKTCPVCGKIFCDPNHAKKVFCSRQCHALSRKLSVPNCLHCGKPVSKPGKQYCSRTCYDNHRTESRNLCLNCGKRVKGGGGKGGYKYCSHACKVEHIKPQPRPCVNCGTVFTPIKFHTVSKRFIAYNAGKTCSAKCQNEWIRNNPERKRKIGEAFAGARHPNWQGGKSAINLHVHRGPGWNRLAEKARNRDGRVCMLCGKTEAENGRRMDVHHIVTYHDINNAKKANRLSNLISLCKSCHKKEDNKIQHQQIVLPFAAIAQADRRAARASAQA